MIQWQRNTNSTGCRVSLIAFRFIQCTGAAVVADRIGIQPAKNLGLLSENFSCGTSKGRKLRRTG